MKVLVTGGNGFLGSWICRVLTQFFEVTVLVRTNSDLYRLTGIDNLKVIKKDVEDWASFITESRPEVLVLGHWWGVGNKLRNDDRQFHNVSTTCELALAAREAGVSTIVGVGSQAELGPISDEIYESATDRPTTRYGEAKVETRVKLDNLLKNSNSRFIWMRIFSTYGPLDDGDWLIPQTVDTLLSDLTMNLTKGEQEWSYLHAYDLAMAFKVAVENINIFGIVNVGNPETVFIKEAVETIALSLNRKSLVKFGEIDYRPDQVMKLKPSCEKLTESNWKPVVKFNDGIIQTIAWLKGDKAELLAIDSGEILSFRLPLRRKILR